jgi:hypothetical protein
MRRKGGPDVTCSSPSGPVPVSYEVAITDSSSAEATATSGLKLHVTLVPLAMEQVVYVDEDCTILTFAWVAGALRVKVTESMSLGVVAFSWY